VSKLGRRDFMLGVGGAALAGAVAPAQVFAQAGTQRLAVRRAVGTMQPNDPALASYFLAVQRMKALPDTDPLNWNNVAQIHVNFCPHRNWFFLPWHRAYLVAFERICRQVSGDPSFALPYWDWTVQRQIPPAFAPPTVGGRANPLFDETREADPDDYIRIGDTGQLVIARAMSETVYEQFGSTRPTGQNSIEARWLRAEGTSTLLESTPHGGVHVFLGGDMGDMISPRDPLFWLHHCNIDRLWAQWNSLGRANSTDPLWLTYRFDNQFQVPQGQGLTAFNVGVSDVLDHRAFGGYAYPDPSPSDLQIVAMAAQLPPPPPLPPAGAPPLGGPAAGAPPFGGPPAGAPPPAPPQPRVLAAQPAAGTARLNGVLSTKVTLMEAAPVGDSAAGDRTPDRPEAVKPAVDFKSILNESPLEATSEPPPRRESTAAGGPAAASARASLPPGRLFSVLEGVRVSGSNAMSVNVFLNHPNPTASTPESDPHFVGTFSLFGMQGHAAHNGGTVQVEITETAHRLQRMGQMNGGQLDIQAIPVVPRITKREASTVRSNLEMSVGRIKIVTM
jgi:hypothetical protein